MWSRLRTPRCKRDPLGRGGANYLLQVQRGVGSGARLQECAHGGAPPARPAPHVWRHEQTLLVAELIEDEEAVSREEEAEADGARAGGRGGGGGARGEDAPDSDMPAAVGELEAATEEGRDDTALI